MPNIDFSHLSPQERLDLIGELWDSLDDGDVPVPADMKAELERRNAAFDADRRHAVSWEQVRAKLRARRS